MDDNDGSSSAAQSARDKEQSPESRPNGGIWFKIGRLFGGGGDAAEPPVNGEDGPTYARSHGLANLRNMRVEDVAIPKADIVAVPSTATKDELAQVFRESGLTRLPVYDGTLDTPIGMAHLKDFALGHALGAKGGRFNLQKLLRPLLYVPPSMPTGVLLTKMQTERRHMALVIDEYGGVDGLVTIEDLIEQVVGEIEDEHDIDEGRNWTRERTGCYLAFAKTPLEEFEAEIGMPLTADDSIDAEEVDTLGGLVFVLAGRVPARGEVVPHPAGLDFEVVEADPRRIKRLRVRKAGAGAPRPAAQAAAATKSAETAAKNGDATPDAPARPDEVKTPPSMTPSRPRPQSSEQWAAAPGAAASRMAEGGRG